MVADDGYPGLTSTNKKINRSKLAQSRQFISYVKSNTENSNEAVRELALGKYTLCPQKVPTFKLAISLYGAVNIATL